MNDLRDIRIMLFGASSALVGLGLQYFLPVQYQLSLTRFGLLFVGLSIPVVYYCILIEIWLFKKVFEMIKENGAGEKKK